MKDDKFDYSDGYVEYRIEIKTPGKRRSLITARIFFLLVFISFMVGACILVIKLMSGAIQMLAPTHSAIPEIGDASFRDSALTENPLYSGFELNVNKGAAPYGELRYSEVYERCSPSVVGIFTSFNGRSLEVGTGVIISSDGFALTCDHLLTDADNIDVLFSDGTGSVATVAARDGVSDLALIKFDSAGRSIVPAEFSEAASVGDTLLLIGNPINRTLMLTDGLLSGKSDNANINGYPMKIMMTNAVVEDGHSGAPLFNLYGQVVGIANSNLRISGTSGSSEISFVMPAETVKSVVDDLMKYGRIPGRPSLGVNLADIQSGYAAFMSLPLGAVVESVLTISDFRNSRGELRSGDIIIQANGERVESVAELMTIVNEFSVGDDLPLVVWRNREEVEITVTLVEN